MKKSMVKLVVLIVALLMVWLGYKVITRQTLQHDDRTTATPTGLPAGTTVTPSTQSSPMAQQTDSQPSGKNLPFETGLENLPRSLQGTEVDGEIIIDGNQNLVVTEGLRRLFDYFLSTLGEEDADTINARVETYITHHTPDPAASRAVAIYRQYVEYLKQLGELQNRYGDLQLRATKAGKMDLDLARQRQQDIDGLRQQMFDQETIDAFFAQDDELFDYNVAMIELAQDESLTDEQRALAKQDYLSRMPDSLIKQNAEQQATMQELMRQTERLEQQGATDAELFAMRAKLVGVPAAERLAQVDAQNRDFDARFEQYQTQKQAILTQQTDPTSQQQQISELENQLFDEAEKKRLVGYAQLKSIKESELASDQQDSDGDSSKPSN